MEQSYKLLFLVVLLFLTFCAGATVQYRLDRNEAIRANAAEYYLDSQNQRQFRYKTK